MVYKEKDKNRKNKYLIRPKPKGQARARGPQHSHSNTVPVPQWQFHWHCQWGKHISLVEDSNSESGDILSVPQPISETKRLAKIKKQAYKMRLHRHRSFWHSTVPENLRDAPKTMRRSQSYCKNASGLESLFILWILQTLIMLPPLC